MGQRLAATPLCTDQTGSIFPCGLGQPAETVALRFSLNEVLKAKDAQHCSGAGLESLRAILVGRLIQAHVAKAIYFRCATSSRASNVSQTWSAECYPLSLAAGIRSCVEFCTLRPELLSHR